MPPCVWAAQVEVNRSSRVQCPTEQEASSIYMDSRSVTLRGTLPSGRYAVLPTTFLPGASGRFLLRVFSHAHLHLRYPRPPPPQVPTPTSSSGTHAHLLLRYPRPPPPQVPTPTSTSGTHAHLQLRYPRPPPRAPPPQVPTRTSTSAAHAHLHFRYPRPPPPQLLTHYSTSGNNNNKIIHSIYIALFNDRKTLTVKGAT